MPEASIVIPVYNKWDLTRKCLKAISAYTPAGLYEVIVVDNASSDDTVKGVPALGKMLFGENFHYIRNEENRNFAGASNQGADAAKGEYIIFLNNDTEVQAGWLEKLLKDFADYPDIAATGPLLLYPDETPLGKLVQHLGVMITPFQYLGHLHQWIPADSPLARKRRFFQAITAACMVIPKKLFMDIGKFDEEFRNGFEDVDLCARLTEKGYRMTVNPEAVVIHHESMTPGRHANENRNSKLLKEKSLHLLQPDWHRLLREDGLELDIGPWQRFFITPPKTEGREIAAMSDEELKAAIVESPFSQPFWDELLTRSQPGGEPGILCETYLKLFPNPEDRLKLAAMPWATKNNGFKRRMAFLLRDFIAAPEDYLNDARRSLKWCSAMQIPELALKFAEQIRNFDDFSKKDYPALASALWKLERSVGVRHNPHDVKAYNLWIHAVDAKRRKYEIEAFMTEVNARPEEFPRISALMPVYNPEPDHLRAALDSVRGQIYPNWELCVADDASTAPGITDILKEYAEKDPRIKAVFRKENGHIAKASNSALELASGAWTTFLDQDDLLTPDALAYVAKTIRENPEALMVFSDEDKTFDGRSFFMPYFKNGRWDDELIAIQNYVCHLVAYRTDRMGQGFRADFSGAQDHDFTLRYTKGMDPSHIIHIPHVLYHWRSHPRSTAQNLGAKTYVQESWERAANEYLQSTFPGASAIWQGYNGQPRPVYPLPEKIPSTSLVLAPAGALPLAEYYDAWQKKTAIPFEMIVVTDSRGQRNFSSGPLPENIKIIQAPDKLSYAAKLLFGAKAASGDVVGLISPDVIPSSSGFLEEILSCLSRKGIGAVGGKLLNKDGSLADAGFIADAQGGVKAAFSGWSHELPSYFHWNNLARTVDAVNGKCLFTRRDLLLKKGLNSRMREFAPEDYCIRLGEDGLKTVWWPYAEFTLLAPDRRTEGVEVFAQTWRNRLEPANENLLALGESLDLADPEDGAFDFSLPEYLRLYPDIARAGMDPLDHYLNHGLMEGREGHIAKIDYSRLTPERIDAWKKAEKNGVVVCTSLCGDYERLLPPAYLNDGWTYVCYSDRPRETWGVWEIREIPCQDNDLTRKSRWAKMNLPALFPDAKWVFWQDANIVIGGDLSGLLEGRGDAGLWMVRHPARECVYQEAQACLTSGKESKENLDAQMEEYAKNGMPQRFGMWENNFFLVDPANKLSEGIFAQWREEYGKYGKRDQLSLPYVFFRKSFLPAPLLPDGKNARNWPALHFLTHEETRWIAAPETALS